MMSCIDSQERSFFIAADSKPNPLLFRCDANVSIGAGHVMRCVALAQAWEDAGGRAAFVAAQSPDGLLRRIRGEGFEINNVSAVPGSLQDAELLIYQAGAMGARWVVVDGDQFGVEFLRQIRDSGVRILLVDDFGGRSAFPAEMVLNPNFGASQIPYRGVGFSGEVLAGEKYVLLRREFRTASDRFRRSAAAGHRVLITLGGTDPTSVGPKMLAALASAHDFKFVFVAGPGCEYRSELEGFRADNIEILFDVDHMPTLMRQCEMAVIVAGGTLWELLYSGCVVLSYTRNTVQESVISALANKDIVANMGDIADFQGSQLIRRLRELCEWSSARGRMAAAGQQLIDGKGAERVVERLRLMRE
jgi:UDP-2,4-diacetamido-2,4,6-trideoxy-beta-L-altropyranose hydrolase